jgi:photosystem II stability/assembly factor-like uncharacterized protein
MCGASFATALERLTVILAALGIGYVLGWGLLLRPPHGAAAITTSATWTRVGPRTIVHAILLDPGRTAWLYAATAGGVLRSDDGGVTWATQNSGLPAADPELWSIIAFEGGRRLAAAADDAHVYVSADAGDNWRASSNALGAGSVLSLAVDPAHATTLLAGGTGGIWRSNDGGLHWCLAHGTGDAGVSTIAWSRVTPGTIYAGLLPGPGQILRSRDGGTSWRPVTVGLDGREGIMALAGPQQGWATVLAGTMGHGLWRLEDGTGMWHFSGDGLPAGQHVASLLVTAGGAYAGTMGAGVYASRDHGRHWAPLGRRLAGSAGLVLALAEHATTLLAGTADGIYRLDGQIPFR